MPRVAAVGRVAVAGRIAIPQTENFILGNRNCAGANWFPNGTTVATGFSDPLGGVQAAELNETAVVGFHTDFDNTGVVPAVLHESWLCASCFMQAGSRTFGVISIDMSTSQITGFWNLTTGAATLLSTGGPVAEPVQLPAEDFGGGWRRYSIAARRVTVNPISPTFVVQFGISTDGVTSNYLGVVGQTIRIFAPSFAWANRPGPVTDTTAGVITTRIRNEARGRVAP